MILVSIVLPTYNGSRYLGSSIQSILNQDYQHWELIIVDDGSTDETAEIANNYAAADQRISVIRNRRNRNLPRSLNRGFREAQGELWTWTSDDNILHPSFLSSFVRLFNAAPNLGLAYSNYSHIDASGRDIGMAPECAMGIGKMFSQNIIGASFMYRSNLARRVGTYDPRLFLIEDWDYWIRCSKHGEIQKLEQNLYYYRVHSASLTGAINSDSPGNPRRAQHHCACARCLAKNLRIFPRDSPERARIRRTLLRYIRHRGPDLPYTLRLSGALGLLHLLLARELKIFQFMLAQDSRRVWISELQPALRASLNLFRPAKP